jgi:uncharacterized protein with ParB-like and HNH nuclease domain
MKTNHQDIQHFTVGGLFQSKDKYLIPIYQRNYEWTDKQIIQLLDDIRDYYVENEEKNYFTGTLICDLRKSSGYYEAIDGQQRLTTYNLIICALRNLGLYQANSSGLNNRVLHETNIHFEARPISDNSIRHVFLNGTEIPKFSDYNDNIISAISIIDTHLKQIQKELDSKNKEVKLLNKSFKGFVEYLFEKVVIVRVQVPEETDLNHYFEIMNSRGEQLEKHEILKSRLMKQLNECDDAKLLRRQYNIIWEACSQMDTYVQLLFQKNFRDRIFGERWFSLNVNSFEALSQSLPLADNNDENQIKFNDIIGGASTQEIVVKINALNNEDVINESDSKQFQPIINFENFLLHVLKLQCPDIEISLDDKRLLHFFKIAMEKATSKEQFAKDFIFNLLKTRFLLDTYVIKRKYQGNENFWSLETLKFYPKNTEGREKDSFNYVNTFERSEANSELTLLLSMFHVSTPTLVYKHWLFFTLNFLFTNYNRDGLRYGIENPTNIDAQDYREHLILTAKTFLKYRFLNPFTELSYDEMLNFYLAPTSFTPEDNLLQYGGIKNNLVFNYIDYLLWKKGNVSTKDFEFSFRSSVEHFYPRNPISGRIIEDENILNCIGNLCLISHENNSRYSNFLPKAKRQHYENAATKESLKQTMMMEIERVQGKWDEEEILNHRDEIYDLLQTDLNS